MKQLIQSVSTGELAVVDVPVPQVMHKGILVRTHASLVSAGTERSMTSFAQANLLQKARSRPDLVRQTLDKMRRDGVLDTIDAVRNRLDQPMTLGYSAAGEVIAVGDGLTGFRPGDRVACAGGGFAVHAQVISIPRNLAVVLPESVTYEQAAFTTLGAIAMHGIRLARIQLGETVAVIGLGMLGLLTVQMLRAAGVIVIGNDPNDSRAAIGKSLGAHWTGTDATEFASQVASMTNGRGADAVLITADTPSNQPIQLAGEVARNRGVVISVGAVGIDIPRKPYFEKELDFRISRSYGPGRYDAEYEVKGHDYPVEYVRWTENRNMESFVSLVSSGAVNVDPLITHRYEIEDARRAYDLISGKNSEPFLGVLLTYATEPSPARTVAVATPAQPKAAPLAAVRVGVAGAGLFASAVMLPVLKTTPGVELVSISSGAGVTARSAASKFGFANASSSFEELIADPRINTVAILTRHDLHAPQTIAALRAGKHVFVEKPLCLTLEELSQIEQVVRESDRMLMVGYNRRFAPFVQRIKKAFHAVHEPLMITYRVNAGFIPASHWTHDAVQGGGRLRGEGCHFVDLIIHLAGSRVRRVSTRALPDSGRYRQDNFEVSMEFENGSLGTLLYVANGPKSYGKEMLEVFGGGMAARIDDYRHVRIDGVSGVEQDRSRLRQDKGHRGEWAAIVNYLTNRSVAPVELNELLHSVRVTLAAQESLQSGAACEVVT